MSDTFKAQTGLFFAGQSLRPATLVQWAGQSLRLLLIALAGAMLVLLGALGSGVHANEHANEYRAGAYLFSDELGGFEILSVYGIGTRDDPIVITQRLEGTGPVTMVVRRLANTGERVPTLLGSWMSLYVQIVIENKSGRVWNGFEVELQEKLGQPSVYGDGLSFDQGAMADGTVASDSFVANSQLFEPYDRIRYDQGAVNPNDFVTFGFHITDPTPVPEFYIVEDPRILFALQTKALRCSPSGERLAQQSRKAVGTRAIPDQLDARMCQHG